MKRYRWIIRGAVLALLLALGVAAALGEEESPYVENEWNYVDGSMDVTNGIPEDAEGALADIRDAGVLRVATEPYFPPQEFIDPTLTGQERYVGSDMSLARVLARRMGVDLVIVPMEFTEVLNAVREGYCDLAISALSYTPGRAATVELSKGYFYAEESLGSALLIRAEDAEAIKGVEDLKGRDIVAQGGSLQEMLMAENVLDYHEFRRLPSMQEVYDAVANGEADAAMADASSAQFYVENNPEAGLMLLPDARFTLEAQFDGDRVAGKKGEFQLMYFVNGVIDELMESGQYRYWYNQYEERAARLGM